MTRRSSKEWQSIIEQQAASGLSVVDFCKQQQLNNKYFYARKRSLLKRQQGKQPPSFIKVPKAPTLNTVMVLQVAEVRLSLPTTTEADWLAQLLKAVSA